MDAEGQVSPAQLTERDLRKRIDRSVSRALADNDFAAELLTNPALALEDRGCTPQQRKSLLSIQATTLADFARQAQALFWAANTRFSVGHDVHELARHDNDFADRGLADVLLDAR
jgi:hypothetical protein